MKQLDKESEPHDEKRNYSSDSHAASSDSMRASKFFPERLKKLIGEEPLRSFAARCGLSAGSIHHYLNLGSEPGLSKLIAIAQAADVNLLWLATGEGAMRGTEVNDTKGLYYTGKVDLRQLEEAVRIVEGEAGDKPVDWKARMMVAIYDLGADVPNDKKVAVVRAAL